MKKAKSGGDMRRGYKRSDFPGGLVRGNYAARLATGSNIVRLKPDIAAAFPTSEAVNSALAGLLRNEKAGRISTRTVTRPRAK